MKTVRQRNQTLECCRILAAVFVVFLHVPFPGLVGKTVNCLARFAVPLFFAISGWFSYGAAPKKLLSRLWRIVLLEAAGIGVTAAGKILLTLSWGGSVPECLLGMLPTAEALGQWLVWNADPFAGHLWYLSAMAACYGVLWLYTLIFCRERTKYLPLYILGGCLLAAHFAMGNFSRFTGISVAYIVYRNGWFFGLPMFAMGLFLRQYRKKLPEKQGGILLAGLALSLMERWILGPSDLPVAMVPAVAAILLLADAHPILPESCPRLRKASDWFGPLSTAVYILHLTVNEVYPQIISLPPSLEPWLRPVLVAALSVATGLVWLALWKKLKKLNT